MRAAAYLRPRASLRTLQPSYIAQVAGVGALNATQGLSYGPVPSGVAVEGGSCARVTAGGRRRRQLADGCGGETSEENTPDTSRGCSGACARAVRAVVVANNGREWREGGGGRKED